MSTRRLHIALKRPTTWINCIRYDNTTEMMKRNIIRPRFHVSSFSRMSRQFPPSRAKASKIPLQAPSKLPQTVVCQTKPILSCCCCVVLSPRRGALPFLPCLFLLVCFPQNQFLQKRYWLFSWWIIEWKRKKISFLAIDISVDDVKNESFHELCMIMVHFNWCGTEWEDEIKKKRREERKLFFCRLRIIQGESKDWKSFVIGFFVRSHVSFNVKKRR